MANPYTKSQGRGKRGGQPDRPNRVRAAFNLENIENASKGRSTTALILDAGVFCKDNDIEEVGEHARKSLTASQHLGVFTPDVETIDLISRKLVTNPTTGEITVVTSTNPQVIWKGDTNLLRPNPFKGQDKDLGEFKRLTSRSKRTMFEHEVVKDGWDIIDLLRLTFKGRSFRLVTF